MSHQQIIRRYYEELWNRWHLTLLDELIAEGIRFRGSLGVTVQDRAGFRQYLELVRAAFPDFHNTIDELLEVGDRVVARMTYRGTHRGELLGIPATGKTVTYSGIAIFRLAGGKITEGYVLGDALGVLQQLLGANFWRSGVPR